MIAVVPVFNERKTLKSVLARELFLWWIFWFASMNGSEDDSLKIFKTCAGKRNNFFIVDLPFNTGMAGAIKQGFLFTLYLERVGFVRADDIVVTIDADGQHKPEYLARLLNT